MTQRLDRESFLEIVRLSPLVSIDLVVRGPGGEVLVGHRLNAPARSWWFVPGGRICKGETIAAAFRRISGEEIGRELSVDSARFLGVYEHHYDDNVAGEPGFGTHYVVLAYEVRLGEVLEAIPGEQHGGHRWLAPRALLAAADVHPYTKAYLSGEA